MDEPLVWYEGSGLTTRRWFHADERGSIIAVSDATGSAIAINAYDEYGQPADPTFARFQYTGQAYLNEIGLYYYKARMYHPVLGRFMQTDPIGYAAGPNLYAYVKNDPVNFVDPLGLDCQHPDGSWVPCGDVPIVVTAFPGLMGWFAHHAGVSGFPSGSTQGPRTATGGKPQEGDFHYKVRDFALCSADELFDQFRKPGNSAPGAPAATPGTTPNVILAGGNPITQIVDVDSRTITNLTQRGHRYHSGSVVISVVPTSYGSAVTIEGRGTGPNYLENRIGGALIFSALAAKATISCTVGGD